MSEALSLLRRWVQDYFNRHDAAAARDFCAPDYALRIGDVVLAGRDDVWLPAVDAQMRDYPGLTMTVHETMAGEGWAAIWFSEHGQRGSARAVWSGVGIYRAAGGVLTGCIAQEDYFTRRRQLKTGQADAVDRPAVAPWDEGVAEEDPEAGAVVLDWLAGDWPRPGVVTDDEQITGEAMAFEVAGTEVHEMHAAGGRVAFAVRQSGTYRGGLPEAAPGADVLDVTGLVTVSQGVVTGGRVIRDRMGLWARRRAA